jgi:hypothetical protein
MEIFFRYYSSGTEIKLGLLIYPFVIAAIVTGYVANRRRRSPP